MSFGWQGPVQPIDKPTAFGWLLIAMRLPLIAIIIFGLMVPMILARMLGAGGIAQRIVQLACKLCLGVIGLRLRTRGKPMKQAGAVVANHSSWLDIFTMNAAQRVYFVSKSDVSGWPVIGVIARSTGTVFIRRKATDAAVQRQVFRERLGAGHRLLFFPEGTSTDGRRVLPFRSSLFAAFFDPALKDQVWIQPLSAEYTAPDGQRASFYGWWGDMSFADHFLMVLERWGQGSVELTFHDPLPIAEFADRKQAAAITEQAVRGGMDEDIQKRRANDP